MTYHPQLQWKPKRRDRDPRKRLQRQRYNRKNRVKNKMRRRRYYQRLKRNQRYKALRKQRRKDKKRKFYRAASERVARAWMVLQRAGSC